MKVFISSLITGFEDFRAAAASAVRSLGHEPIMAETFAAGIKSPRIACLDGIRAADIVVLILGERYGAVQDVSGLSATHEEYREAKGRRPVISFFQGDVDYEASQADFVREVQDWSGGLLGGAFRTDEQLRDAVVRAIHQYEVAAASTPVDASEMLARALELIPSEDRSWSRGGGPLLHIVAVGGPAQTILRPTELEAPSLIRDLLRDATYGNGAIFDPSFGAAHEIRNGSLLLKQETGASILIDERGSVRLSVRVAAGSGMLGAIIEENVAHAADSALFHLTELLTKLDPTERLARIAIAAAIDGSGSFGWRTQREDQANPNSMAMASMMNREGIRPVHFQPPDKPRAALAFDRNAIVEDLITLLRRQWN